MIDVAISYDVDKREMTVTSQTYRGQVIAGTDGDSNTTTITFTFDKALSAFDKYCAFDARQIDDEHVTFNSEYELAETSTANVYTVLIPGSVMSSEHHGRIPIQLHFVNADSTVEYFSLNQVVLTILPSINDLDVREQPTPRPVTDTARVIRVSYIQTNTEDTEYMSTNDVAVMPSSVTILRRHDGSESTTYDDSKDYDEVHVMKTVKAGSVKLTFFSPPGNKTFWLKVII